MGFRHMVGVFQGLNFLSSVSVALVAFGGPRHHFSGKPEGLVACLGQSTQEVTWGAGWTFRTLAFKPGGARHSAYAERFSHAFQEGS